MEAKPGTYALILSAKKKFVVQVGKLGEYHIPAGYYVYVGSAFGPGGLKGRVERHLRAPKKRHWHIDYMHDGAAVVEIWQAVVCVKAECTWAAIMHELPGASCPIPRFGASDCSCESHLFHFCKRPQYSLFTRRCGMRVEQTKR